MSKSPYYTTYFYDLDWGSPEAAYSGALILFEQRRSILGESIWTKSVSGERTTKSLDLSRWEPSGWNAPEPDPWAWVVEESANESQIYRQQPDRVAQRLDR
jgi:hypothetical protein